MAYGRQYPFKSRKTQRRNKPAWDSRNHKINYAGLARKAFTMGKIAMGLLNTEKKFFDTGSNASTASTTGAVYNLGQIARGTAENNRIGGSVLLKNLLLRLNAHWNTSGTVDQQLRCILVQAIEDIDGTAPTFASLLANTAAVSAITSPLNLDNVDKYKILLDKVITLDPNKRSYSLDKWIKFGMDKNNMGIRTVGNYMTFDASDNLEKGGLFLMVVGSTNTNPVTYDHYTRLRFIDN